MSSDRMTRDLKPRNGRPAHRELLEFVQGLPPTNHVLGLTHVTTSYLLRDIIAAGQIEATEPCDVMNERVTYAFYGRAAFRGKSDFEPTTLSALFPSVLILDPTRVPRPKYVFPFDSGAFMKGRLDAYLHPYMPLFDFLLAPDPLCASKLVRTVFGSNEDYLRNKPLPDFEIPPANFEADSYKKIVLGNCQATLNALDDRVSTPEIIFSDPLEIRTCVIAAILPDTLAIDERIGGALKSQNIDVYEYVWTSASRPVETHFVVRNLIHAIFLKRGWL